MKIRYCLPILKKTKKEVLETIQNNLDTYEYFEVWLDTISGIDNIFVNEIVNMLDDKLILLFQRGESKMPSIEPKKKLQFIQLLQNTNSFIDLDLAETKELAYVQNKKLTCKKIISYHNYKETPGDLPEIIKQMDTYNPAIYKIAAMCNSETDALKLLLLQQNLRSQNKHHIILGMGKFGTITRVYGTLWGNELIYAPLSIHEITAPGQLLKGELAEIFKLLA